MAEAPKKQATQRSTKAKKGIKVRSVGSFPAYELFYEGGGDLPKPLKGTFTSKQAAEDALKSWRRENFRELNPS